jgi:cytochrome c-type biogenesis protein CcmE
VNPVRRRRLAVIAVLVVGVGSAAALGLRAFRANLLYFYSPSQVAAGEAPHNRAFRIGGLVESGSVQRDARTLVVNFTLTDTLQSVRVHYEGVLPDLFREGQGIVANGRMGDGGVFIASEVLAKHDENYMPPEVAKALEAAGKPIPHSAFQQSR